MSRPPSTYSNGVKLCRGPSHAQPTWVVLDERRWSFHRTGERAGRPFSRCKDCHNWETLVEKGGPHGRIPIDRVVPVARELVERCGNVARASQASAVPASVLHKLLARNQSAVYASTAQRLFIALLEQRKWDRRNGASDRFVAARKAQAQHEERLGRLAGY